MKRYKPSLTNTQKPWPHLDVKILEASMVECEGGDYIKYSPMQEAAPKMYAMLDRLHEHLDNDDTDGLAFDIRELLAEARGEL